MTCTASSTRHVVKCLSYAVALMAAVTASAQVPQLINYQGRVAVNGVNLDGDGMFRFALVNEDGSVVYWRNSADTSPADGVPDEPVYLPVAKGLYSVLLGDDSQRNMAPLPPGVFSNPDVRLRVWFNDGVHGLQLLSPDQRIAAVGYAMTAGGLAPGVTIPASAVVTAPPGMVLIPAGAFTMGNTVAADTDITDAAPVSTTLSAFYIAINEVTLSQWQAVYYWATSNGYSFSNPGAGKSANHPVHSVNWYDVVKWCNARSEMEGLTPVYYTNTAQTSIYVSGSETITNAMVKWNANGYRLPTEAEWEKAARGGLAGQRFPWGNTITQNLANYTGDTSHSYDLGPNGYNPLGNDGTVPYTTPVGTFAANGYGLHDMAGNVFEWCWDWYGTPYAGGTDPRGPTSGSNRVGRGGGWLNLAGYCRAAYRSYITPAGGSSFVGFRPARSSVP